MVIGTIALAVTGVVRTGFDGRDPRQSEHPGESYENPETRAAGEAAEIVAVGVRAHRVDWRT